MIISIFILIVGLLILGFSANYLINSSIKIGKSLHVSHLFIGLTIVAFGTSAPELFLSATAAINGNGALSVGNVIGSNIFNLGFILGLSAIFLPIIIQKKLVYRDGLFLLFITILIFFMLRDQQVLMREGISLLVLLIGYNSYLRIKRELPNEEENNEEGLKLKNFFYIFLAIIIFSIINTDLLKNGIGSVGLELSYASIIFITILIILLIISLAYKDIPYIFPKSKGKIFNILILISSLGLLVISADHVVNSAIFVAKYFGISQRAIGATIVAAGTSLPEIAATLAAIMKKHYDIGVGNVVGSDIFNILGIIGISSIISPLHLESKCIIIQNCNEGIISQLFRDNTFSVLILFITLIITFSFMKSGWKISKKEGIILFSLACLRMIFEINPNFFIKIFS